MAPVWITGTYDQKRNIAYWGTGKAALWPGDQHPGDNLYTRSVIALNPGSGKLVGYHHYHPDGSWDWDEIDSPILLAKTVLRLDPDVPQGGVVWVFAVKH